MGQHPDFSRVVFELDSPVGYKVERRKPSEGVSELIISLNASAEARTLRRKLKFIESLEGRSRAGRSTVHGRLRGDQRKLKGMILANPPRIVLDVMHDKASTTTKTTPFTRPSTAAKPKSPNRGKKIAKTTTQKPVKAEPTVSPVTRTEKPAVSRPSPVAKPITKTVAKTVEAKTVKPDAVEVAQTPSSKPATSAKLVVPNPKETQKKEAVAGVTPRTAPKPSVTPKTKPASRQKSAAPLPAFAQSLVDYTGLSPVMLAAGSVGAVFAVVGFILFRRRSKANAEAYEDFDDVDNLFPTPRDPEAEFTSAQVNAPVGGSEAEAATIAVPSFGDPGEGSLFGDLDPSNVSNSQQQPTDTMPVAGPGGRLFDDDEKEESTVEQMSTPMAGMDASGVPGAMPPAGDIARIVTELEQRLNTVETRLDESVEACERLERQMAAQSEELRVQRAAIARTQRALRSLSRTDDEQATEPAIREPR